MKDGNKISQEAILTVLARGHEGPKQEEVVVSRGRKSVGHGEQVAGMDRKRGWAWTGSSHCQRHLKRSQKDVGDGINTGHRKEARESNQP